MCSTDTDSFSMEIAFSTGMTCIPTPPPPGGTICVMPARGSCVIRLKKVASSGCSSVSLSFIIMNSALPGTKIGTLYILSLEVSSFLVISTMPIQHSLLTIALVSSTVMLFILASSSTVYGTRVFLKESMNLASSFESMWFTAQNSGSLVLILPVRRFTYLSVIIVTSFKTSSVFSGSASPSSSGGQ